MLLCRKSSAWRVCPPIPFPLLSNRDSLTLLASPSCPFPPLPSLLPHFCVPSPRLLRYIGRWYQVYADLATTAFESNYCVVADYGVFANGTVSVRNRDRLGSVTGAQNGILGWASINNRTGLTTSDGSLSVYLQVPPPAPQGFAAPYDVVLLGPMSYGPLGLYEYAGAWRVRV